jgi:hypothetical protein
MKAILRSLSSFWRTALAALVLVGSLSTMAPFAFPAIYGFPVLASADVILQLLAMVAPGLTILAVLIMFPPPTRESGSANSLPEALRATLYCWAICLIVVYVTTVGLAGYLRSDPGYVTTNRFWLALAFEMLLAAGLAGVLRWYARRLWHAFAILLGYFLLAHFLGQHFAIIEYIGFGLVPTEELSRHHEWPVGSRSAWSWRAYWASVLCGLWAIAWLLGASRIAGQDPRRRAKFVSLPIGGALLAGLASSLINPGGNAEVNFPDPSGELPVSFAEISERPTLARFRVDVDARSAPGQVSLSGAITLRNEHREPIRHILFEKAQTLRLDGISSDRILAIWRSSDLRLFGVTLTEELLPGDEITLRYGGTVILANRNMRAGIAAGRLDSFFLHATTVLPMPRTSACAVPQPIGETHAASIGVCAHENYMLGDRSAGLIDILVEPKLTVAGAQNVTNENGESAHRIRVQPADLSNFLIAVSHFRVFRRDASIGCPAIAVFVAPFGSSSPDQIADSICRSVAWLNQRYPRIHGRPIWLAEVPNWIASATALGNGLVIGDSIMSAGPPGQAPSPLLEHIIAHEISHHWWGYRLPVEKGEGEGFVLEGIPQFVAFDLFIGRGQAHRASLIDALRNHLPGSSEVFEDQEALWTTRAGNSRAYLEAPMALLTLDQQLGGQLGDILAQSYVRLAINEPDRVSAHAIVEEILSHVPQAQRSAAADLFGFDGEVGRIRPRPAVR